MGRCWTSDRLERHNLQNNGPCAFCQQASETIEHLLLGCPYSREVWFKILRVSNLQQATPAPGQALNEWWLSTRLRI
ncbi:hypothetical protein PR202_gb11965 [Eleusine coracana subsp. coracana]|uniref:Reverse transcriptase zinc-binding domain-containing protein n=1 Tax=Eleusine coracana subsp. coracana TaxID=191504 RepID=A0AAV5ELT9_ELECO|nr:hypothetical protein PR202_gb11965 [Eleusine coracana subsp. coracana]